MKKLFILTLVALMLCCAAPALGAELVFNSWEDVEQRALDIWVGIDDNAWLAEYERAHPVEVAAALRDPDVMWRDYGYESKAELMESWGLTTEAEYRQELLQHLFWEKVYDACLAQAIAEARQERGGTAAGLGVLVNGRYVAFPDAQPEITKGRTMVPFRGVIEALGGTVDYVHETRQVLATINGADLNLTIGQQVIYVERQGEKSQVAMDCAAYVKGGRTYIPVRFIAEAAGLGVQWDPRFQTAVILDQEAMIKEMDKDFTILNSFLAEDVADPLQAYRSQMEGYLKLTMAGQGGRDISGQADFTVDSLSQGANSWMECTYELGQLMKVFAEDGAYFSPEDVAAFERIDIEVIQNADSGLTYASSPFLAYLFPQLPKDAWLSVSADILPLATAAPQINQPLTMGGLAYLSTVNDANGVFSASEFARFRTIMGLSKDSSFTRQGSGYVLSINRDNLIAFCKSAYGQAGAEAAEAIRDQWRELNFRLTLNGQQIGLDFSLLTAPDYDGSSLKLDMTMSMGRERGDMNMKIRQGDLFQVEMDMDITFRPTAETPPAAPPAGSRVIDIEDLLDEDISLDLIS